MGPERVCGAFKSAGGDRVRTQIRGSNKPPLEPTVSFKQGCLTQQQQLSPNSWFPPRFRLQTWSLRLLSKSSFSTSNPKSPLNSFILLRVAKFLACVCFNMFPWHSEFSISQPVTKKMYSIPPVHLKLSWGLQGIKGRYKCPSDP